MSDDIDQLEEDVAEWSKLAEGVEDDELAAAIAGMLGKIQELNTLVDDVISDKIDTDQALEASEALTAKLIELINDGLNTFDDADDFLAYMIGVKNAMGEASTDGV